MDEDTAREKKDSSIELEAVPEKEPLPIVKVKAEVMEVIRSNQIVVVTGDTGSGKSTQMAQFLYEAGYHKNGIIAVTQPRRIGAVSVAKRVSQEMGCELGSTVGYTVRFDDCTSPNTAIKFVTDGCLLREVLQHKRLEPYSVIVLDEAHERSVQTDILFGVMRSLSRLRKDLRIIITSATLDVDKFTDYFFKCPAYHVDGRCFPVKIVHSAKTAKYYVESAVTQAVEIHCQQPNGHILIFLTGQEEIEQAVKLLTQRLDDLWEDGVDMLDVVVLPIYGGLSGQKQQMIFQPVAANTRKILVSTNICETSLTVDGIVYVIDAGYVKQKKFDPTSGIDALTIVPISQVAAVQRAGRAGRTRPGLLSFLCIHSSSSRAFSPLLRLSGHCYRLYTPEVFANLDKVSVPEIQRTSLTNTVLLLKSLGIWLEEPRMTT
jgi:HrpA-like RNA helicase